MCRPLDASHTTGRADRSKLRGWPSSFGRGDRSRQDIWPIETEILARCAAGKESHPAQRRGHSDPISPISVMQETVPMHAPLVPADAAVVTGLTVVAARDGQLV